MSTNYYWVYDEPKPQFICLPTGENLLCNEATVPYAGTHVGKRYGCGEGNTAFILACDLMLLMQTIKKKMEYRPGEKIVEDEYGRQFTAREFSILLHDNERIELHSIGESFC